MSSSTGNGIEPIEGYERVPEMAAEMPATRLVYVADREADLLAMMARAQVLGTPTDWLVRAKHNRCLPDGDGEKLWAHTSAGAALGEITFTMPGRDDQKARKVRQQLWAREVSIANGKAGTVLATCIVAGEIDAPKGVKPVEWRLLTNRAASTLEDAIELIDWYRARWEIEIYFNVLKNGCKVEALQLSAIDRIERALALFMIVAWRVAYLMRIGRTCPDLDAALFFHPDEIRGAYLRSKKPQPAAPPRLNEVMRLIAQLGRFLGRKSDGEPGVKTIWQGLQRVMDVATALQSMRVSGLVKPRKYGRHCACFWPAAVPIPHTTWSPTGGNPSPAGLVHKTRKNQARPAPVASDRLTKTACKAQIYALFKARSQCARGMAELCITIWR